MAELQELYSGVLHKVGGKVKTWNRRFFILKSDFCLYYYKDTNKGALGTITLKDPNFKARKGEAKDTSWPRQTKLDCTMAIETSHRIYCVYCDYSHEIDEWIEHLTNAKEKVTAESRAQNRLSGAHSSSAIEQASNKSLKKETTRPQSTSELNYEFQNENQPQSTSNGVEATYALASSTEEPEQALYEDVNPVDPQSNTAPTSTDGTPSDNVPAKDTSNSSTAQPLYNDLDTQPLYEDIPDKLAEEHRSDKTVESEQEPPTGTQLYEDINPSDSVSAHEKSHQPLYDDVATEDSQPLYEDIASPLPQHDHSDSEEETPPLPSRTPPPPLPTREGASPHHTPTPTESLSTPPPTSDPTPPPTSDPTPPPTSDPTPPPTSDPTPPPTSDYVALEGTVEDEHGIPSSVHGEPSPSSVPTEASPSPVPREPSPVPREPSPSLNQEVSSGDEPNHPVPKPRAHHAGSKRPTEEPAQEPQDSSAEQGIVLFKLQKQRLEVEDSKRRSESIRMLEDVSTDPTLSSTKKAIFAETLREVEQEKLLASEERFRWERERKKLEEERRRFEEEKKRMEQEIQQIRQQTIT